MKQAVLDLESFLPYRLSVLSNTVSAILSGTYSRLYELIVS